MFVSDTSVERNTLMEQVYPKLKSFCQERGYDFQVVDMRWGIREEATDDHMMTELCMRELQTCQKLSTGPNFVVSFPLSNSLNYDLEPFGTQSGEFLLTRGPARLSLCLLVFGAPAIPSTLLRCSTQASILGRGTNSIPFVI